MDITKRILREEVEKYGRSARGANIRLFSILDDEQNIYAVNAVDYPSRQDVAGVVILARLVGNIIVIEEDMGDKKLVDALMNRNISRDQIVLAYDGEAIPDDQRFQLDT